MSVKPVVKGLIIGCSVFLALAIVATVAIGRFAKKKGDDFVARGKAIRSEGAQAGRRLSESECLVMAMERYRARRGMVAGIRQRVWLAGCLETSTVDSEFCAGVPSDDELSRTVAWRLSKCTDFGSSGDSTCPNVIAEVQTYCYGGIRKAKGSR